MKPFLHSPRNGALHPAAPPPPFIRRAAAPFIRAAGALFLLCAAAPRAAAQSPWRQADFAADLYRRAAAVRPAGENVVLSPWGVANLFALLQTGARGDTAKGMAFALDAEALRGASGPLMSLSFPTTPGRVYVVQTANAPTGSWERAEFFLAPGDAAPVNLISLPSTPGGGPTTVYLLPAPDRDAAFFRVKSDDAKAED